MKKLRILLLIPILSWGAIQVLNYFSKPTAPLGVVEGNLAKCAARPNSVCSQATDKQHFIEPLVWSTTPEEAWESLRAVVERMRGVTMVEVTDEYMRCEFRTSLMRYIDDVEFMNSPAEHLIHARSASRIGHSDLGANRKRIERIRSALSRELESGAK